MKNVLFMLAFMLMGTFAFAGNGQKNTKSEKTGESIELKSEKLILLSNLIDLAQNGEIDALNLEDNLCAFTVTYSCGYTDYFDCTGDDIFTVLTVIWILDSILCES